MRVPFALLLAGALGCGSDLLLPDPPGGGTLAMSKVDGDQQVGTVGEALPSPLVVQVLTERGAPAAGKRVAFMLTADESAGRLDPDTAVTTPDGRATAHWVLGTQPGSYVAQARLVTGEADAPAEEFKADAKPAQPDTLSPLSPQSQPGRRRESVTTAPVVRVVDRFGNPVAGATVSWEVTAGAGQVSQGITPSQVDGSATVQWTLGNRIGVHKLTASVGAVTGSPVTFTVTVLF